MGAGGPGSVGTVEAANPTDRIIVKFKSNASQQAINSLNASLAVTQVDAIPALGIRVLRVPPNQDLTTVLQRYQKNSLVDFAEPDAIVTPGAVPNDQNYGSAWHLPKIQAPAAWDSAKATGVLIAICDTGVASVADLTPVLRGDLGYNTVDNSRNWAPIAGHGTLVAGAAGAATNNSTGVAGVAWGAQILPVRISNQTSGSAYVSDAAECITYAADKGARVANLSYRMAGYAAIDSAAAYGKSKGMVTVVAAGNDGTDPGWTNYAGFLAVAATTSSDVTATYSNYGAFVDISAPGTNVYTTRQDGTYGPASGTSLASPVVAGTLALIFGANPGLSAAQAESILLKAADDLGTAGYDPRYGHGRVNALKAVTAAKSGTTGTIAPTATAPAPTATASAPAPTPTPAPAGDLVPPTVELSTPASSVTVTGNVTLSAKATDNVGVVRVDFYVDGKLHRSDSSAPYSVSWNSRSVSKGSHVIKAVAVDAASNTASDTHTVTVR